MGGRKDEGEVRLSILLVVLMLFFSFPSFFYGEAEAEHVEMYPEAAHSTPGTCTDPENRYSIEVPINWHDLQWLLTEWHECKVFATTTGMETAKPLAWLSVSSHPQLTPLSQPTQEFLPVIEGIAIEFLESFGTFDYTIKESKIIKLDTNREAYLVQIVHESESTIFIQSSHSKLLTVVIIPDGDRNFILAAESVWNIVELSHSKSILQMIKSFRPLGNPDTTTSSVDSGDGGWSSAFSVNPVPIDPTTVTTPPERDDGYGGEALFIIIIVVIVVIIIKRRKKKIPIPVQTPPGGGATTSPAPKPAGRGKILRRGKALIMGKQPLKQKSEMEPIHLLRCGNIACRMEKFLVTEADGQQYCTKCGWKKR